MLQINNRGLFVTELAELINSHSLENDSDTPDFVLAEHLTKSLESLNDTIVRREQWYGRKTGELGKVTGDCLEKHDDLCCNLPLGHDGPHQATDSDDQLLCKWGGDIGEEVGDCLNKHEDLFCNLPYGHDGPHEAFGTSVKVLCTWKD